MDREIHKLIGNRLKQNKSIIFKIRRTGTNKNTEATEGTEKNAKKIKLAI